MPSSECRAVLTSHRFGRLAFASRGVPVVLPVNYLYRHPLVIVRTGAGRMLDAVPMNIVAFEVDDAADNGAWGWSVAVEGPAFDITSCDDDECRELRRLPVLPWAPGSRQHWLKIVAGTVTGRRFGIVPTWSGVGTWSSVDA